MEALTSILDYLDKADVRGSFLGEASFKKEGFVDRAGLT